MQWNKKVAVSWFSAMEKLKYAKIQKVRNWFYDRERERERSRIVNSSFTFKDIKMKWCLVNCRSILFVRLGHSLFILTGVFLFYFVSSEFQGYETCDQQNMNPGMSGLPAPIQGCSFEAYTSFRLIQLKLVTSCWQLHLPPSNRETKVVLSIITLCPDLYLPACIGSYSEARV